jgi:hypothetical protein
MIGAEVIEFWWKREKLSLTMISTIKNKIDIGVNILYSLRGVTLWFSLAFTFLKRV